MIHLPGFNCEYCHKHFNRKSRLRKHMVVSHITHSAAVLSVCDRCGQTFAGEAAGLRHWSSQHAEDDGATTMGPRITAQNCEKVLCCEFCEAAYVDVDRLAEHKKTHDGVDDKFECQYCPAKYNEYSRLKTHSNCHAAIKTSFPVKRWWVGEVKLRLD